MKGKVSEVPNILAKLSSECAGTALLVSVVIGSGIMGAHLSEDLGVVLLINAASTVAALAVIIVILGPVSGAHLNPAVSLVAAFSRTLRPSEAVLYVLAQTSGAIAGAILANLMFDLPAMEFSQQSRLTLGTFLGEVVATAGLLVVIIVLTNRSQNRLLPIVIPLWIGSAYFFASSTSFANPAVTIGRMFSDTFAGIHPSSVPAFLVAQILGAVIGLGIARLIVTASHSSDSASSLTTIR